MATTAELAEEDLELYGEPVPESPVKAGKEESGQVKDESLPGEQNASNGIPDDPPHPITGQKETASQAAQCAPDSIKTDDGEKGALGTVRDETGGSNGTLEEVPQENQLSGNDDKTMAQKIEKNADNGDNQKDTNTGENGDEEEGEEEEEEEEESEDDDFDVILNVDDADVASRPANTSFGSIGKVRLGTNKWQRPGYVPPERVIGNSSQGAARTGGLLSMLPTPTMQVGNAQKSVYDLEIGKLTEKPWLDAKADLTDYFNYGFTEETWKLYCERQKQMRLEVSMLAKIKTVDGNKTQAGNTVRTVNPSPVKPSQTQQHAPRGRPTGQDQAIAAPNTKLPQQPPMPPPGMMPPPMPPQGGMPPMPNIPGNMRNPPGNMPVMPPNMPFPFHPSDPAGKGRGFTPPFPSYPPMQNGQRNENMKNNMFPFYPGMPGFPGMGMPMPGTVPPPGMGRGDGTGRGFPGQMAMGNNQQPQDKHGSRISPGRHGPQDENQNTDGRRRSGQGHQSSRFGNAQGAQMKHQGRHDHDGRRQRWVDNRGHGDRRQDFDRHGGDGGHGGRRGYEDRGYGDRNQDRRRWNDNREEGYDNRRRGGGYDGQRMSDNRRDFDRDRERGRDYRKRPSSARDFDDDRKRTRR
ncbi:Pre-mRNA 3'-end-processing factor FIP1 [Gracilariopsis chorda]|uniref:Pre-mRNA 3'-end-processing factor FIP1 n=1 Tax=Gracilariopsis chorda TaxID=448386 RepID=A0A2V3IXP8_9FLOR|nr:Pre-mRNA 3'-end-processing factor FIP1 [Gracilariopsis chorda]|eukprot:PXF45910.1 Pre-mRNA 3'-end-processing factor FIP1 [Gracilariopsis chorda]